MTDMLPSPRGRAASVSSHGTATTTALSLQPRYVPRPDPRYISQTSAADRVTRLHLHDQYEMMSPPTSPTNEGAIFHENALRMLNAFLDALLYNFLGKARGTSLNKLRPAIREVLKAKLARDALAGADEEIQDLYEDTDDENDREDAASALSSPDWHVEETFKLMRLRVMVFLGLGDFDDEDEERFLEEEEFHINGEPASPDLSILNGPTAVYLASILEYLAERLIDLAGEAAYARQRRKHSTRPINESQELDQFDMDRVTVEETDVEKIALNPTYGRLWRTWRKQHRSLKSASVAYRHARVSSDDGPFQNLRRINSNRECEDDETTKELSLDEIPGEEDVPEHVLASNIPLPMTENDVNEIEVPGLATEIEDGEEEEEAVEDDDFERRPRSAIYFHEPFPGVASAHTEEHETDDRPALASRKRSLSAPHLIRPAFLIPLDEEPVEEAEADELEVDEDAEKRLIEDSAPEVTSKEPSALLAGEEDEEFTSADEILADKRDELEDPDQKHDQGMVAGVLTGATALVGTAIATVAGSRKQKEEPDSAPKVLREAAHQVKNGDIKPSLNEAPKADGDSPLSHEEAVALEMGITKIAIPAKPVKKPVETLDDSPLTHEEAIAREMGVAPLKESVMEVNQTTAEPPAKVGSVDEVPDLDAAEVIAATDMDHGNERSIAWSAPSNARSGQITIPPRQEAPSMDLEDDDHDPDAIGIARTSNVRIHSSSPSLDQSGFPGHIAAQDRRNENFARPSSRDRNAAFGGMVQPRPSTEDEYALTSKPQQRYTTPSPLREVASATGAAVVAGGAAIGLEKAQEMHKERQQVVQNRDKPGYGSPIVQQQPPPSPVKRTSSKESGSEERGPKAQPLQTDFQDPVSGRPPSSNYSARSSASQTPHSARGSQSSIQPRVLDKRPSDDIRARNFDELVKGEETVKFTLTPDTLRDDPYNLSTNRSSPPSQGGASDRSGASGPSPQVKRVSPPRTSSARSSNTSQQPPASPTKKKVVPRSFEYRRSFASLAQRPQPMNTNARKNGLMPREPRVVTDHMRDFADYLRSTAPANELQATPAPLAPGQPAPKQATSAPKPRTGSRMQARDPDVKGNTSSDLIDFIRRGPPGAKNVEHRIPRTVAPFRTTMDSDDFNDYTPGVTSPRQSTSGVSSTGPRSTSRPTNSAQPPREQGAGGGPVRKQRRVKDPYAIDSDSDDDDTLTALPAGRAARPARDESLADFLRNTEPPAANGPAPLAVVLPSGAPPGSVRSSRSAALMASAAASARQPSAATPASSLAAPADPAPPRPPPKRRLEARVAGATRDFQTREYRQPTADLASFLGSSGPAGGADGAGGGAVGLKSGVGSKRGRQRGWLGLRVSRSIDA